MSSVSTTVKFDELVLEGGFIATLELAASGHITSEDFGTDGQSHMMEFLDDMDWKIEQATVVDDNDVPVPFTLSAKKDQIIINGKEALSKDNLMTIDVRVSEELSEDI